MTSRVNLSNLYPIQPGETPDGWTDRLLYHARTHGTYRQCSIGRHDECSQRGLGAEAECRCVCHEPVSPPGLIAGLLATCRAEVAEYQERGSNMGDYEQLAAAGRAEFAQEIINTIEGTTL